MVRLEGRRVVLRPLRPDELDQVLEARGRLRVGDRRPAASAQASLRRRLARSGRMAGGYLDLAVEVEGRLIGEVQARGCPAQTLPPGVFELGIVLYEPADRGRGSGGEAVELLTGWLFEQASTARVQVSTGVGNAAMRRVLDQLGFRFEGVLRAFGEEADGSRSDYGLYAMTEADWRDRGPEPARLQQRGGS